MQKIIRDSKGKMVGSIHQTDTQTYLRDFSGKVVATYREGTDTTLSIAANQQVKGEQLLRFLPK